MRQSLAQKIIARAAGRAEVTPGEIVTCKVDLAMMHDSGGPRRVKPMLDRLGAKVWDPTRVVLITDHYVPAVDEESRGIQAVTRAWVREAGIGHFYDGQGICHVVLPERGHLRPGMLAVGGDSHSPTGGAFGAYIFGVGSTEMVGVLVTGEIWLKVPETIVTEFDGALAPGVSAKDVMLFLARRFGLDGAEYQAVEFRGSAVRALPMQERMTLANMTTELGAQTGLIAPDETTRGYLESVGVTGIDLARWQSDADAPVRAHHRFDAAMLAPQVAAPHSPTNADAVGSYRDVRIDVGYIGACTGAKLADLRMAARILKGRRKADGVRLMVAPASARDQEAAGRDGTLEILSAAGAEFLPNACGACAGYGANRFADNTVVIATTARNFRGRMGAASSEVYLASPYTVAASAVAGRICDPRDMLS